MIQTKPKIIKLYYPLPTFLCKFGKQTVQLLKQNIRRIYHGIPSSIHQMKY